MLRFIKNWSQKVTDAERRTEIDLIRGVAVFFMIFIHVKIYYLSESNSFSILGGLIDFMGTVPNASVFMLILGIGFAYRLNKEQNEVCGNKYILRGIYLLLFSYFFNVISYFLPWLILQLKYNMPLTISLIVRNIGSIDILQFAALAMITLGLFAKWKLKPQVILIIIVLIQGLNCVLVPIQISEEPWSILTGLLWGSSENSYFPYTTWIFFPLVGFLFGSALLHCKSKKAFYGKAMLLGLSFWVFSIYVIRNIWNIDIGTATAEGYYHHIFWGNYTLLAFDIFWVGLFYFMKNILPQVVRVTLTRWSKQVILMYLIQWMLIDWSMLFISENSLSLRNYLILSVLFLVLSDLGAYKLQKIFKKRHV